MPNFEKDYTLKKEVYKKENFLNISRNKGRSLFSNLIGLVKNALFPAAPSPQKTHSEELQKCTKKTLVKLLHIKEELKSHVDGELFKQIEFAIDPITRDAKRIQQMMTSVDNTNDHDKTQKKFHQWIAKAERWVKLETKLDMQISVIDTIIDQYFTDMTDLINQDLQVIADYKSHLLINLAVSPEEKENLKILINEKLSFHITELQQLKEKPDSLDLHKIGIWKDEIDEQRSHHFDNALHKIDAIIEQMSPIIDESDDSNDLLNALEFEAKTIERDAIALIFDAKNPNNFTEEQKTSFLSRFQWLQQKTHQQHLDLDLPTEQSDQLGKITSVIERINQRMKSE
ncbi:MAG: hypothetical protein H0U49_09390 [Parachlamydiaceae bacterium]|nr:hypothetical protein [Parachlamydiaceae bacterium]